MASSASAFLPLHQPTRTSFGKPAPLRMLQKDRVSTDPKPVLESLLENNESSAAAAAAMLALALTVSPLSAEAAQSGGRMGGSYSSPAPMTRMAPRSSSSYSRGYSSGFSSGYMSRPSVTVVPGMGYGYGLGGFPGYYGGAGALSIARGPSLFDLLFFGGFAYVLFNIATKAASSASDTAMDVFDTGVATSALGTGTSVVQMSVALEVPNRDDPNSILSALSRLSRTARTDSRAGIQDLTSQVALELLRRRSSIVSASSAHNHFKDRTRAGREFNAKSIQQRSKFEQETFSQFGGVDYSAKKLSSSNEASDKATMAVVTLILAIDGDSTKPPQINSISDVETALRKIASDAKVDECLQSAEILWTPDDRSETLSMRDVVADYPDLRSV